ncbi:MAG: sugar ABC transporter permease [Treponema sp.]|jgi:raffinose/stachyose/melibiose transport system permease protein|nr:sugar ABC transporter permease [Treponema sp.]
MYKVYRKTNVLYIPALIILLWFVIYPFFDGLRIAFTNWNGYSQSYRYIGFENFKRILTDVNIRTAVFNTLAYGFGSTFLQQILGLGAALLLDRSFMGRAAARTILYLPVMISGVIMGYMWQYMTGYSGALNDIVKLFGKEPVLWLSSAKITIPLLIIINSMQYFGISMVIYLAGLQGIPEMYYEAARIEGSSHTNLFFNITFPLLYPALITSIMINLIGGLKLFDVIRALTGGGPGYATHSVATLINVTYFGTQNAGYAAVLGLLLFVMILIITIVLQNFFSKREVDF